MSGPEAAPAAASMPRLPAPAAAQLAYYAADGMAVLAPRGWHCLEVYDSAGAVLLVTPDAHTADDRRDLTGPAVEMVYLNGWNSGRFDVARVLARLFPSRRAFVRHVVQEGLEAADRFPRGPYPHDTIRRLGRSEVAYVTPARRTGMGTAMGCLAPDAAPVDGMATLARQDGVTLVDVRLPRGSRFLATAILRDARRRG